MNLENKTILVTGGAGAIGGNLVKELLRKHCKRVIILDNLHSGFRENIPKCESVVFVEGDVCDDSILEGIFLEKINIVFHLAAQFANQNSIDNPIKDLRTNGEGILKVLTKCVEKKVDKFVYSSSSCVYGNKEGEYVETDISFDLETPYGITKLLGEYYTNFFNKFHKLNTVIVRYFNCYGPGERPGRYRNVIPNFVKLAAEGKPLTITGTGEETRDFTYVADIIDGTILAAEVDKAIGETINISSGVETKIIDLAEIINELTGNRAGIIFSKRRNWDHTVRRRASITKAKEILGYIPKFRLRDGIVKVVQFIENIGEGADNDLVRYPDD